MIKGLGIDRHPELLPTYFGNYHRLVYLAQTDDPALVVAARRAARRLGLAFELRRTGYGDLATSVQAAAAAGSVAAGCLRDHAGRPSHAAMLSIIWWRDIPAQVVAKDARRSSKVVLHPRFQVAIDKAANRAGKRAYNDYIEEWRKTQEPCGDDLEAEARRRLRSASRPSTPSTGSPS